MNWIYTLKVDKTINFENTTEFRLFSTLEKAKTAFDEVVKEAKNDFGWDCANNKPLEGWEFFASEYVLNFWRAGKSSECSCFAFVSLKEVE